MADISAEIAAFRSAAYGEDVREALIQLAQKLNGNILSELETMQSTWNSYKNSVDQDLEDFETELNTYTNDINRSLKVGYNVFPMPKMYNNLSTGNISGEIGNTITISSASSNYKYLSFDVNENELYYLGFYIKNTKTQYAFVCNNDGVILDNIINVNGETDTYVEKIIFIPHGATTLYVNTYTAGEHNELYISCYDKNITRLFDAFGTNFNENYFNLSTVDSLSLNNGSTYGLIGEQININTSSNNYKYAKVDVIPGVLYKIGLYARSSLNIGYLFTNSSSIVLQRSDEFHYLNDTWVERYAIAPKNAKYLYINTYISGQYQIAKAISWPNIENSNNIDDNIPNYYRSVLSNKIDTINEILNYNTNTNAGKAPSAVTQFVFFTDYHYDGSGPSLDNTKNSPALIKYILKNTGCSFVCHGGDIINNKTSQKLAIEYINDFMKSFEDIKDRLYCCIGNHEYNNAEHLSYGQIHNLINSTNELKMGDVDYYGDYYVDDKAHKIRYFFIGCDRRTTGGVMMSANQLHWIFTILLTVPNDFDCVLFAHRLIYINIDNNEETITPIPSNFGIADGKSIIDGIDAYNNKGSYLFDNTTYNFNNTNGKMLCIFTGHSHMDTHYITSTGTPVIMTTTDCCPKRTTEYDWTNKVWIKGCTPGTVEEQAFDVVTLDKTRRKVFCTRIGYGEDREFNMPVL